MPRTSKRPVFLSSLIAFIAAVCFVATFQYERAAAQSFNGKIAFTDQFAIFTINPDGSGLNRLTPSGVPLFDRYPAWSPDGDNIAFSRTTVTTQSQIYVMGSDGSKVTRITNNSARDRQPSWSPDGTKIAFVSDRDGNDEIYVMNADGSNQKRLTNNTDLDTDLAWSPDGTKIVFSSARDTAPNRTLELYVMNADGSNPIRLTNNSVLDAQPSWSTDGTRIAFTSHRDGTPVVYVMNADGSNPINLTQSTFLDSSDPEWSPDGTTIAFKSYNRVGQTNNGEIFFVNADGTNIRRISNLPFDENELAWQPLASAPAPTPTPTPTPTPSPSPTPDWTISGKVTDSTGKGLAEVTMILQNSIADTQITFTDQNGNYVFHYPGGNGLFVTPSKTGFAFNPLSIGFVSSGTVTGDQTASFTGTPSPIPVGFPILLDRQTPKRAIALDSVKMTSEPFTITNTHNFSSDQRTRVSLFAVNVDLAAGEPLSVIEAQAEDSLGQVFPLTVEFFGAVPNLPWLKQVIVKLPDELANKVEVRVWLRMRGFTGNKVLIRVSP